MNVAVDKDCYFLVRFEWILREETAYIYLSECFVKKQLIFGEEIRGVRAKEKKEKKNQNCPKMGTEVTHHTRKLLVY